jgi:CheY-like chemotaxis protein
MSTILVVDDDSLLLELLRDMLTVAGHRVTAVEGGEAALMAHEAAEHDAALVDMQMPEMDGAATIAALRARSPGLPIVAMSGGGADILRRARAHGADATIAKPFRAERMLDTLAAALGGRVEEKAGVF